MKEYPNFYENITEACRRLRGTVVMYDDTPMYIAAIANHRSDGIFRAYLAPLGSKVVHSLPPTVIGSTENGADGQWLDQWLVDNPDSGILRKMLNSPKFNRFRPFKLGMCNWRSGNNAQAFYVMRQPTRNKEQGLTDRMLVSLPIKVTLDEVEVNKSSNGVRRKSLAIPISSPQPNTEAFKACVLADHPSLDDVLTHLNDSSVVNASAAFDREFAIARGPVGTLFLVYKQNVIGGLPNNDKSRLVVDPRFSYTIEAIEELNQFQDITIKT